MTRRGLLAAACAAWVVPHLFAEVWAWPATAYTVGYLLLLAARPGWRRVLWALAGPFVVVAAYTAPGWPLGYRVVALLLVALAGGGHRTDRLRTVAISLALTLTLTYALDRGVGLVAGARQPGGLVFPRGSVVHYETPEFEHRVVINTYGFRGAGADLSRDEDCRVMLLGDSFTYGWGVAYAQTWGALLEDALRAGGTDARVLNLGVPGGAPPDYAAIATTAGPLVAPDVVVVGVLQGDDLRQITREPGVFPRTLTFGEQATPAPLAEYMTFHYPHIAERTLLRGLSARRVQQTWAATAAAFRTGHTPDQAARYAAVPPEVRADFEAGRINPHFVQLAVTAPDYWNWPLQDAATLAPYVAMLAADLAAVQDAVGAARVIVVSVPHGAYTQPAAHAALRRLGFDVPRAALTSGQVDTVVADAAAGAGLPFVAATGAFRTDTTLAFYPVDGHFNAHGNALLAEALAATVRAACAP